MASFIDELASIVEKINKNAMDKVKNWLKTYYGKIIGYSIGDSKCYVVVTPKKVKFFKGEYPACDVLVITEDAGLGADIIAGKGKTLLKEKKLKIWGNLNDLAGFNALMKAVI